MDVSESTARFLGNKDENKEQEANEDDEEELLRQAIALSLED